MKLNKTTYIIGVVCGVVATYAVAGLNMKGADEELSISGITRTRAVFIYNKDDTPVAVLGSDKDTGEAVLQLDSAVPGADGKPAGLIRFKILENGSVMVMESHGNKMLWHGGEREPVFSRKEN